MENRRMDIEKLNCIKALLITAFEACRKDNGHEVIDGGISNGWGYVLDVCLDKALDVLGVPEDNSMEACDAAYQIGEWPEWGICRDWMFDEALKQAEQDCPIDTAVGRYIGLVISALKDPGWKEAEEAYEKANPKLEAMEYSLFQNN
jgi:hypothetical protein